MKNRMKHRMRKSIWTAMVVHPIEGISVFFFFHIYGIVSAIHPLTGMPTARLRM